MAKSLAEHATAERPSGGGLGALVSRVFDNPAFAKLLKTSTLIFGARLLGAVLGFGTQVALARLLGADALGTFYLALSLAGVMGILCGLGYPAITSRFVAEYRAEDKLDVLRAFVATTRRDTLLVALALLLLFGAGLLLWLGGSPELQLCLLIGALTAPAFAFVRLNGALANAYRRFALSYLPDLLARPALFLAAMAVLVAAQVNVTVAQLLAINLVIVVGVTAFQAVRIRRTRVEDHLAEASAPQDRSDRKPRGGQWRRHALPMVVVALFTALFADFAMLNLGLVLPTGDIAVFGVCLKVALLMGFCIQVIHQLVLPDAADAHVRGDKAGLGAILRRANLVTTAACVAGTLTLVFIGDRILMVFGQEFVQGHTALVILSLSQAVRAAAGPSPQILTLAGQERASIPVFGTCLVVMAGLCAGLGMLYGLEGAAVAVLLVTLIWSTWLSAIASRATGVQIAIVGKRIP